MLHVKLDAIRIEFLGSKSLVPVSWMIILSKRYRRKLIEKGHFRCPTCFNRQDCEFWLIEPCYYLFDLVPCWLGNGTRVFNCLGCFEEFDSDADSPYGFDTENAPRHWECRNCGTTNSRDSFNCSKCRRRI